MPGILSYKTIRDVHEHVALQISVYEKTTIMYLLNVQSRNLYRHISEDHDCCIIYESEKFNYVELETKKCSFLRYHNCIPRRISPYATSVEIHNYDMQFDFPIIPATLRHLTIKFDYDFERQREKVLKDIPQEVEIVVVNSPPNFIIDRS